MNLLNKLYRPSIPIIKLNGVIGLKSSDAIQKQIDKITGTPKALAVVVNSPGGLPCQSDLICEKIKILAKKHHVPIYTFAEDVAASGGYFVLCIGDQVYVDPASIIGSIGVIGEWTGFKRFLLNQGVKSHIFKSNPLTTEYVFDPLADYNPENGEYLLSKLKETHTQFIQHIEKHRNNKLHVEQGARHKKLYDADVFNGEESVQLGLADAIGNYQVVLKKKYPGVQFQEVSLKSSFEEIKQVLKQF